MTSAYNWEVHLKIRQVKQIIHQNADRGIEMCGCRCPDAGGARLVFALRHFRFDSQSIQRSTKAADPTLFHRSFPYSRQIGCGPT